MIRTLTAAVLAGLAAVSLANGAQAQNTNCGPEKTIVDLVMSPKYNEDQLLVLGSPKGQLKLYANLVTGSWTLIGFPVAMPGVVCVIGAGVKIDLSALPLKKGTNL